MNWQDLAGPLVKAGAPAIGTMLGGPLGGLIGQTVGGLLGGALGVPATPEAVDQALKDTPAADLAGKLAAVEAEAQAKWPAIAEIAKAEAEAAARTAAETAATMRAEMLAGDPLQRWWRPIYAFELTAECAIVWALALYDLMWGGQKVANFVIATSGLLMTYWGMRFGVLGVYVQGRSREKEAAITGQLAPTIIEQIVKAVRKK